MSYCTLADVIARLPSGGLPNDALVGYGRASSDEIESNGHGLSDDTEVTFRAGTGGSVPTGLAENITYYAIVTSPSRFKVAATAGGVAINITSDGDNFVFSAEPPWAQWIDAAERLIDATLPNHVTPLIADLTLWPSTRGYNPIIVSICAELAGIEGLARTGGSTIDLNQRRDAVLKNVRDWAKTNPVRGTSASRQSPSNLAVTASAGAVDPRGWASAGNTVLP